MTIFKGNHEIQRDPFQFFSQAVAFGKAMPYPSSTAKSRLKLLNTNSCNY